MAATRKRTLAAVVAQGDRVASLEATRDRIAAGIDALTDRQLIHLAPLTKQLAAVLAELDELKPPEHGETELDRVRKLHADRPAKAAGL